MQPEPETESQRTDRRILRTRQMLRQALLELILERGYDALGIQDITDRADLARATFYLHYRDKEDLLIETMEFIVAEFAARLQDVRLDEWQLEDGAPVQQVFVYAAEQARLYRAVMNGQGGFKVSRRLHAIIAEAHRQTVERLMAERGAVLKVPMNFLCNYYAGALLSLVFWWLENDQPYSPEEMAAMFREVSLAGRAQAMGIDP